MYNQNGYALPTNFVNKVVMCVAVLVATRVPVN